MTKRKWRMIRCKWHKCNIEFIPVHGHQKYCSPECRVSRLEWSRARGSKIVNHLLDADTNLLYPVAFRERQALLDEIERDKPPDKPPDFS